MRRINEQFAAAFASILLMVALSAQLRGNDIPSFDADSRSFEYVPQYRWQVTPVAGGSELVTLIGKFGGTEGEQDAEEVPLISILRDHLPGQDSDTDRLRYVWLLTQRSPRFYQKMLSAVPFFYWSGDWGDREGTGRVPKPLIDLSDPSHHVFSKLTNNIVQWTAFDPMMAPVRASSRAFGSNNTENARLHVAEAIAFLRQAPASGQGPALTQHQIDDVIARLTLTQTLLGGFVDKERLNHIAAQRDATRQASIGRNWELLRTSAERTGLIFEPLKLAGTSEEYAVLWFPLWRTFSAPGLSLTSTWKLLHISNPWTDARLENWKGYRQIRETDANGQLLPEGTKGINTVALAPLAVYSLTYPGAPLLMVDFRHGLTPKRREILQRTSNELAMGVLGLSHFANWYYFAGQAAYQFTKARHGSAEDLSARLDAFSEFRVATALDKSVDPEFRAVLQRGIQALDLNPLGMSASGDVALARENWKALEEAASDENKLPALVARKRQGELDSFGHGAMGRARKDFLRFASARLHLGGRPIDAEALNTLKRQRQIDSLIAYLERVRRAGPQPEVTFPVGEIESSVAQLSELLGDTTNERIRRRAADMIASVERETQNEPLAKSCHSALDALNLEHPLAPSTSLAALPRSVLGNIKESVAIQ